MICWECGKEVGENVSSNGLRFYCSSCNERISEERKKEEVAYIALKKKRMFEKAIKTMEKQTFDIYSYRGAIIKVQKYLYSNFDAFDSSDEIIAAIELIKNGYKIKTQYKVGKFQVDIVIPEIKVALEIDGVYHKMRNKENEFWRDVEIENALGEGWRVIRIPTERLEKNFRMLVKYINALKEKKYKTDIY